MVSADWVRKTVDRDYRFGVMQVVEGVEGEP
jgi:hypothetical protein